MSIRLHPRYQLVQKAGYEITDAVLKLSVKHDLTYVELLQVLTGLVQDSLKYMLRAERHPNDPDKKGDEA